MTQTVELPYNPCDVLDQGLSHLHIKIPYMQIQNSMFLINLLYLYTFTTLSHCPQDNETVPGGASSAAIKDFAHCALLYNKVRPNSTVATLEVQLMESGIRTK